ncbi:hypothetical protein [Hydrogenimonas sp.]
MIGYLKYMQKKIPGLEIRDVMLLEWVALNMLSSEAIPIDDRRYVMASARTILEKLPWLGIIRKETMMERMNVLLKMGILEKSSKKTRTPMWTLPENVFQWMLDRLNHHDDGWIGHDNPSVLKFFILFGQRYGGVDHSAGLILRWLMENERRLPSIEIGDRGFVRISAKDLLENVPMLGCTDRHTVYEKLKKLEKVEAIEIEKGKNNNLAALVPYETFLTVRGRLTDYRIESLFVMNRKPSNVAPNDQVNDALFDQDNLYIKILKRYQGRNTFLKGFAMDREIRLSFETFWKMYPRKIKKKESYEKFKRKRLYEKMEDLMRAVDNYNNSPRIEEARKYDEKEFVMYPSRWLDEWYEWLEEDPDKTCLNPEVLKIICGNGYGKV